VQKIHAESTRNSHQFPPTYQRPDSSFCAEDPGLAESTGPPRNTQVRPRARQRPRSRRRGLGRQAPLWLAKERSRIPGAVADRAPSESSRDVFEASGPLRRYSRSHASTMPRHEAPAQHREITPNTPATTAAARQQRPQATAHRDGELVTPCKLDMATRLKHRHQIKSDGARKSSRPALGSGETDVLGPSN